MDEELLNTCYYSIIGDYNLNDQSVIVPKISIALILVLAISSCNMRHGLSSAEKFHGMWRLDKFERLDTISYTWKIDSNRIGYTGYIIYDGSGHMAVQQNPRGYKDFDTNKNIDSMNNEDLRKTLRIFRSNYVYFASYSIEKKTITHNRLSATTPKDWNTILKRDFEFSNDTLILTTKEKINGTLLRMRWVKF